MLLYLPNRTNPLKEIVRRRRSVGHFFNIQVSLPSPMILSIVIRYRKRSFDGWNFDEGRPTMKLFSWFHTRTRMLELDYIFS